MLEGAGILTPLGFHRSGNQLGETIGLRENLHDTMVSTMNIEDILPLIYTVDS